MRVEQVMTRNVMVCSVGDNLNRAAQLMWENACGTVAVVSADGDGTVVGILTDRDICMAAYTQGKPLWEIPVSVAMARKVISCRVGDDLKQVELLMRENRVRRLPVLDTYGRLQGIVSIDDLAREAERERMESGKEAMSLAVAETLAEICRPRIGREIAEPPRAM
jgi:CBS domain-containing protein